MSRKPMADVLGEVYEQFLGKVIRLTAGHQAKVEEKPKGLVPTRTFDRPSVPPILSAMPSEPRPALTDTAKMVSVPGSRGQTVPAVPGIRKPALRAAITALVTMIIGCNVRPRTPTVPEGPWEGRIGERYAYSAYTDYLDQGDVSYEFDWGDGTYSAWTDLHPAGDTAMMTKSWPSFGTYGVRARARSAGGSESEWSGSYRVSIDFWDRLIGDSSRDEEANAVVATSDNGIAVAGYVTSHVAGDRDAYVAKTDSLGNVEWFKVMVEPGDQTCSSLQETSDGGFVLAGVTQASDSNGDFLVVKTDAKGNVQHEWSFGGFGSDFASAVQTTVDGGFLVVGSTRSFGSGSCRSEVLKLDAVGRLEWDTTLSTGNDEHGCALGLTHDGGFAVAGYRTRLSGWCDAYVAKFNAAHVLQWNKTFGGECDAEAYSVCETGDGGFLVAGSTNSFGHIYNWFTSLYLAKLDSNGNLEWQKGLGGNDFYYNSAGYSLVPTDEDTYLVVGGTEAFSDGGTDVYAIEVSGSGDLIRERRIGGTGDEIGYAVARAQNGDGILAGSSDSQGTGEGIYLVRLAGATSLDILSRR